MIHIWHEDSELGATTQFWNFLKNCNVHTVLCNADIKGFNGNDKLLRHIKNVTINIDDMYHIFVDKVVDNQKALQYYIDIKSKTSAYKNVVVHDLLSFEYMMLKFRYFIEWTEPTGKNQLYSECKLVRKQFIDCMNSKISWTKQVDIVKFVVKRLNVDTTKPKWTSELKYISSEDVATAILNAMTNGGTVDFGISKSRFGNCWHCNCCIKHDDSKIGNKKCRMYKYKKTDLEKAHNLWNNTYAKNIIKKHC